MLVATWFARADLFVAGLGLDLIGAALIAYPILVRSAAQIASDHQLGGFTMARLDAGDVAGAVRAARETAMSRVGIVCLTVGFAVQAAGFFAHVERGLEGRQEGYGALMIVVASVLLAALAIVLVGRWLSPQILAAAQAPGKPTPTSPSAPGSWTAADEITRLDNLAGVLLESGLAASVAAVALAVTLDLNESFKYLLLGAAAAAIVATIFACASLSWSPYGASLSDVRAAKRWRTGVALWVLTGTVEVVALVGLVFVIPR